MPFERSRSVAIGIDDGCHLLGAVPVRADGLDLAAKLTVANGGCENALPAEGDPFPVDRFSPAELGPHGDFSEALGFAGQKAGSQILIDHDERHAEPAGGFFGRFGQFGIGDGVEAGAKVKTNLIAAGMKVEHDVGMRPDVTADELGDAVGDAAERAILPRPFHEGPVQVDAVGSDAVAGAGAKGFGIQHGHQDDAALHIFQLDLAKQIFDRRRSFVLVAVRRAEGDEPFSRLGLGANEDREGNGLHPPHGVVLQADPIVAAARGFEVEVSGADDGTGHGGQESGVRSQGSVGRRQAISFFADS